MLNCWTKIFCCPPFLLPTFISQLYTTLNLSTKIFKYLYQSILNRPNYQSKQYILMSYVGSRIRGPITTQIRCYAAVQSGASSSSATSSPSISLTLILSRLPIITQDLTPFESQFYKYQSELWRRLMWTFPKWFYFKQGTMAELRYRQINKTPSVTTPKCHTQRETWFKTFKR